MRFARIAFLLCAAVAWTAPARAQALGQARPCLHSGFELPAERTRREEALAAMRLINTLNANRGPDQGRPYLAWDELGRSDALASLRGSGGPIGELARKIQWGSDEPLPGWRVHYVAAEDGYAFSLTDVRDTCGFTYSSNDTGAIVEGEVITNRGARLVPIT
jgi:hypothetical protein